MKKENDHNHSPIASDEVSRFNLLKNTCPIIYIYSLNNINGLNTINIWAADYINIFHHSELYNSDRYWVPGLHYNVKEVMSAGQPISYLEVLSKDFVDGDVLYISGIKLSNNRTFEY